VRPSSWPNWLDHLWAKSPEKGEGGQAESLPKHTWHVLSRLADLIRLRPDLPQTLGVPRLWHILFWAAFLHDFGKAASGFQARLHGGDRWHHRHEVLSLAFLDWIAGGFTKDELTWVAAAIVSHHRDASEIQYLYPPPDLYDDLDEADQLMARMAELDEATLRGLWRWLKECSATWISDLGLRNKGITVPTLLPENEAIALVQESGSERIHAYLKAYRHFVRTLNRSDDRALTIGTITLRGYLLNADHSASAHVHALPHFRFNKDAILRGSKIASDDLYMHQKQAALTEGSVLLTAPTGSGKTEAALLWATRQAETGHPAARLFYTLPYQASMNAMVLRLRDTFGEAYVGLQHGRSLLALYRLLLEREYDPQKAAQQAKWMRTLARLNYQPIRVLSPYQMLKGMYRLRGYEALLADYHDALFVFDEIHAYEINRLALILKTIQYLRDYYSARFLVMSATFPSLIKKWLEETLSDPVEITAEPSLFVTFQRHLLQLLDGELLSEEGLNRIVEDAKRGKSVLVVCNTVKRAQAAYRDLRTLLQGENTPVLLLHGRFNMRDRLAKERLVRETVGGDKKSCLRVVLIATQVVEVSLDIDLDTIYTDPAPLEALIQRFGRINRRHRQKGLAPVHVFRFPDDGQGIYDEALVKATLTILEREKGRPVDESKVGNWLDEIYVGEVAIRWREAYDQTAKEFEDICIRPLRAFNANEELEESFYRAFNGTEVLPSTLWQEYTALQEEDPIRAAELLVPISYRRLWQIRKAHRQVSKPGKWPVVVDIHYDSEVGMDFSTI